MGGGIGPPPTRVNVISDPMLLGLMLLNMFCRTQEILRSFSQGTLNILWMCIASHQDILQGALDLFHVSGHLDQVEGSLFFEVQN